MARRRVTTPATTSSLPPACFTKIQQGAFCLKKVTKSGGVRGGEPSQTVHGDLPWTRAWLAGPLPAWVLLVPGADGR